MTNNIMSEYIQTTIFGQPSRIQVEDMGITYRNRYSKAWSGIIATGSPHADFQNLGKNNANDVFLTPVDKELDDYGKKQLTVTQDMIDALKQKVNALGGTRPDVALEYISDNTYELYKTKPAIIKGENATHAPKTFTVGSGDNAVTYNGETITIKNWTNVVTYEVKDETDKFILICSGENAPSSVDTFTIPVRWKDGFRLSAVSVTGERIDIPMN